MAQDAILIADIGGTNARFALVTGAKPTYTSARTYSAAEFTQIESAIDHYLASVAQTRLNGLVLAVAGPVLNRSVNFLNSPWTADCTTLQKKYNTAQVQLLNDWEAIAWALPVLPDDQLTSIGGDWRRPKKMQFTYGALGPGSGLGITAVIGDKTGLTPIVTEGGHAGFAPQTPKQIDLLSVLSRRYDQRVSLERVLSGPGLVNIYSALASLENVDCPSLTAAEIGQAAMVDEETLCQQSLALFFEILGQTAGDVCLNYGAYDGIFIAGGICQRFPDQLARSQFRRGFENKGRYRDHMQAIPTWLITHPNPGLLGASVFAQRWR